MSALAIFDLDGTIDQSDTFAAFLIELLIRSPGRWPRVPTLAGAMGLFLLKKRNNSWLKSTYLTQLLAGRNLDELTPWLDSFVERRLSRHLNAQVLEEMEVCRRSGAELVMATASPDIYVRNYARRLGFDEVICTVLERGPDGAFTGNLVGGNCHGSEKHARVSQLLDERGLSWRDVAFYSDHHSDADCLLDAGSAKAVRPNRRLMRICEMNNVEVLR